MERVAWGGIDEVAGNNNNNHNEGIHPSVPKGEVLPPAEQTMCFSTFRMRTRDPGLGVALRRWVSNFFFGRDGID